MARFTRVFGVSQLRVGFVRGLRFRLAVSYVAFFAILLAAIGISFRQHLKNEVESDTEATVSSDWEAVKLYLHIKNEYPVWQADLTDPEEGYIVERLRRVYLLADSNGNVVQNSDTYQSIGFDSPEEIRRILAGKPAGEKVIRKDKDGVPYMIEKGWMHDDDGKDKYFLAIGRSLSIQYKTVGSFTRTYLFLAPGNAAARQSFRLVVSQDRDSTRQLRRTCEAQKCHWLEYYRQ